MPLICDATIISAQRLRFAVPRDFPAANGA